jgi:hypothetical protein
VSTIKVDTVQSTGGGAVTLTNQAASKAFARYHISNNTVNATLNVSGGTDNGTGDYTLNFINAFSVANDITTGQGGVTDATNGNELRTPQTRTLATSSVRVSILYANGGIVDEDGTTNVYFGALA